MSWKEAVKFMRIKERQPKITISGKTKQIYFNAYIKKHIVGDRRKVRIRYNNESKIMSFQPVNEGRGAYNLVIRGKNGYGLLLHGTNILSQFDIKIKEKMIFEPHWDPKIEWLTISFNNNVK